MNISFQKAFLTGTFSVMALLAQPAMTFAAAYFKDVPETYLQYKAIEELQLRGIISGYADKTFKPDKLITRGEFLKMVFNDVGYKKTPNKDVTDFIDVPADSWIAPYVKKALEINVISATGTQATFNPTNPITRVDAIKIAFPVSGIPTPYYTDIDPKELFKDVRPTAWYAYLARAAKINGIITIKQPTMFWPKHLMTRGDAAELIYEMQLSRQAVTDGDISISIPSPIEGADEVEMELLNNPKFGILLDVWKKANTEFYYKDKVTQDEMVYGAVKGLVDRLGDQYTIFEEPTGALGLQQYLQGEFEGIGTVIDIIDEKIVIMKTLPGSPAEKAQLKTGDVIQKINGQDVGTMTVNQVLDLIRGEAGTKVNLSILRNGQTVDVSLTREKITLSSVVGKMINGIAYISITEFTQTTPGDFTKALDDLNKQSPKGYVIDLRNNPGGYLDSSTTMLGHFIDKEKIVVSTKAADGTGRAFHTDGTGELNGKKITVLVNKDSASAAEIMAGALQDFKVAKLVGTTTYGKGSVQELISYSDDSLLKISVAHWFTPNGRDITGIGLTPDVFVELNQELLLKGTDNQLQKALEVVNQ